MFETLLVLLGDAGGACPGMQLEFAGCAGSVLAPLMVVISLRKVMLSDVTSCILVLTADSSDSLS